MSEEFICASNQYTVHRGNREDGAECGTTIRSSDWVVVKAENAEDAVMNYNLRPCIKCIDDHYIYEAWRKDIHSAMVTRETDVPQKWRDRFE